MFASIVDDFDPRYWTTLAIAVVAVDGIALAVGVAWLIAELLLRVAWYLALLLAQLLFPPAWAPYLLPPIAVVDQLVQLEVTEVAARRAKAVEVDTALTGWDYDPTPDPVLSSRDLPPDPASLPVPTRVRVDDARIAGLLGILRSSDSDGAFATLMGSSGFESGLADVLTTMDVPVGAGVGGLGVRGGGPGGGGTGEGLGGMGTIGIGGGGGGGGSGYGQIGSLRGEGVEGGVVIRSVVQGPVVDRAAKPELDGNARAWVDENGSTTCTVTVDVAADGTVTGAKATGCPRALRAAAERAARESTWKARGGGTGRLRVRFDSGRP